MLIAHWKMAATAATSKRVREKVNLQIQVKNDLIDAAKWQRHELRDNFHFRFQTTVSVFQKGWSLSLHRSVFFIHLARHVLFFLKIHWPETMRILVSVDSRIIHPTDKKKNAHVKLSITFRCRQLRSFPFSEGKLPVVDNVTFSHLVVDNLSHRLSFLGFDHF